MKRQASLNASLLLLLLLTGFGSISATQADQPLSMRVKDILNRDKQSPHSQQRPTAERIAQLEQTVLTLARELSGVKRKIALLGPANKLVEPQKQPLIRPRKQKKKEILASKPVPLSYEGEITIMPNKQSDISEEEQDEVGEL